MNSEQLCLSTWTQKLLAPMNAGPMVACVKVFCGSNSTRMSVIWRTVAMMLRRTTQRRLSDEETTWKLCETLWTVISIREEPLDLAWRSQYHLARHMLKWFAINTYIDITIFLFISRQKCNRHQALMRIDIRCRNWPCAESRPVPTVPLLPLISGAKDRGMRRVVDVTASK